jgi:hypothetical protein
MRYMVVMASDGMIYIPSFIKVVVLVPLITGMLYIPILKTIC